MSKLLKADIEHGERLCGWAENLERVPEDRINESATSMVAETDAIQQTELGRQR